MLYLYTFIDYNFQQLEELKNMSNISAELKRLQDELDESHSQLTITKLEMEGRLEEQTRKYNEENSSLHKALAGNISFKFIFIFILISI